MSGRTVPMLTRTSSATAREGGGSANGSGSGSNPVKLAGEESKDKLYEPKHSKKLVRVLTVVAYMFSVSLAAIMLSVYYVFLWNPRDPPGPRSSSSSAPSCQLSPPPMQYQQELNILRQHLLQHHQQLQQQEQQRRAAAQDGSAPQFQPLHQSQEASSNVTSNFTSLVSSSAVLHTTMNQTATEQLPT